MPTQYYGRELVRDMDQAGAGPAVLAYDYVGGLLESALEMLGIELPDKI